MPRLVICYRTEDASTLTRQIVDHLQGVYPGWKVLQITQEQPFRALHNDDTVIMLVGAAWQLGGIRGQRWLDQVDDVIHMTLSAALTNHTIFLIPVLLNDSPVPHQTDFPLEFEKFGRQEFFNCHTNRFESDMNLIVHALRVRYASRRKNQWLGLLIVLAVLLFLCGGGYLFTRTAAYQSFVVRFNEAVERLNPDSPDAYSLKGWVSYKNGDYEQAIANFERAITLRDNLTDAYDGLGWTFYKLQNLEKARENFDRVVELAPYSLQSYQDRGWFNQGVGDVQGAIADFEKAVKISPNNETAFMSLAQSYQAAGEYEKAVSAYQRVTQINSGSADAYRGLGESNDALGRTVPALQSYQRYIELAQTPDPQIVERVKQLQQG